MDVLDLTELAQSLLPLALADIYHQTEPGDKVTIAFPRTLPTELRRDLVAGAGFGEPKQGSAYERLLSLPDTVASGMTLLVCGLNPSIYAAESGVGFGRPGNRFWPAALEGRLVTVDRDPRQALLSHGVGMTDLVKRATRRADELTVAEYRAGLDRVSRLTAWLTPGAVCFVGLAGWRAAVDRKAVAGLQGDLLGGRPVYLMPSTSGLNAHSSLGDLTGHLRAAAAVGRSSSAKPSTS